MGLFTNHKAELATTLEGLRDNIGLNAPTYDDISRCRPVAERVSQAETHAAALKSKGKTSVVAGLLDAEGAKLPPVGSLAVNAHTLEGAESTLNAARAGTLDLASLSEDDRRAITRRLAADKYWQDTVADLRARFAS